MIHCCRTFFFRVKGKELRSLSRSAHCHTEKYGHDIGQRIACGLGKTVGHATLAQQVTEEQHTQQRYTRRHHKASKDKAYDGEYNLLVLRHGTRRLHLDDTLVLGCEKSHDRRLYKRHKSHVRVCRHCYGTHKISIVTILLGMTVGASTQASEFLTLDTIFIFALGFMAFIIASASGVIFVKIFNLFLPAGKKLNPLIGNAGVSAVPMSARISNNLGLEYDPSNYLLMHAMGPNVAGVIGSAVAAGVLLGFLA